MTQIKCSNSNVFLELLEKLRAAGVKVSGCADDLGFFYVQILDQ